MTAPTEKAAPIPALLPCPFCGKEGAAQGASRGFISVWCGCGARGPEVPFPEDSIDPHIPILECRAAWNRRADREARSSLPDSREERIREDERGFLQLLDGWLAVELKAVEEELAKWPSGLRASFEITFPTRARQGGNNG